MELVITDIICDMSNQLDLIPQSCVMGETIIIVYVFFLYHYTIVQHRRNESVEGGRRKNYKSFILIISRELSCICQTLYSQFIHIIVFNLYIFMFKFRYCFSSTNIHW